MVKTAGLLAVYNEADYLPYALKQMESFCDYVFLVEGCHSKNHPTRSSDGTIEILEASGHELWMPENTEGERYDTFQCNVWKKTVEKAKEAGCDWFRWWDCDMFFFDKDMKRIKETMKTTDKDCIKFNERRFLFNWKMNTHEVTGFFYRLTPGLFLTPISRVHNANGQIVRDYPEFVEQLDVTCFHFSQAKKLARAEFRFKLSEEKGTPGIPALWEMYKGYPIIDNVKGHEADMQEMAGGFGANIYNGPFPEALDGHPYRFCNDIRTAK